MLSIADIIELCGGAGRVAEAIGRPDQSFVLKWRRSGIPDRHWPVVMRLGGVTLEQVFEANSAAGRYDLPTGEEAA